MQVCNMCRSQLADNYNMCPNCGNTNLQYVPEQQMNGMQYGMNNMEQQYVQQVMNQNQNVQSNDSGSFGWAVLGFLIPIVGWILYFVWKNQKPNSAKMAGIGGIVGFLVSFIYYSTIGM